MLCRIALLLLVTACARGSVQVEAVITRRDAPLWLEDPEPTRRTALAAAGIVGADLGGWSITMDDRYRFDFGEEDDQQQNITIYVQHEPCPQVTALAHEVLHVGISDADHRDPVWRDSTFWRLMAERLAETTDDPSCLAVLADESWWMGRWMHL